MCMFVSEFVTTEFLCLMDDESARTLGVLDVDGWKKQFLQTHSSVVHVVEGAAKRRLFLVMSVTP